MSNYDYLKRAAEQAAANGRSAFSGPDRAAACATIRQLMDSIANGKSS